ncbi:MULTISPECIES: GNAT family N-acetyltransferase [unclassified Moraxella]|uniref:GNAT family N-acetyltransferase n=1 Tax=unclassified Moraxella TaxID=2685852 RepID=UPI003AF74C2E
MIKPANPTNAEIIAQVICDSIRACHADHHDDPIEIASWTANKTADNVRTWLEQNYAVNALDNQNIGNKNIVGVAMLSPKGELLLNYVLPTHQGKGVGKAMLNAICDYAKNQNLSQIYLESTKTAKEFYQAQGFLLKNDVIENGEVVAFEMVLPL